MIWGLFWNARGVGNSLTISRLWKLKKLHSFSFLILCEPMVDVVCLHRIKLKLGFCHALSNKEDRLWFFHAEGFTCSIVLESPQCLVLRIKHCAFQTPILGVFVHAFCDPIDRASLWSVLVHLSIFRLPMLCGGDFMLF